MRVLIVDDDRGVHRVLGELTDRRGYDVSVEADGETAWDAYQREPRQLVILDWMLTGETTAPELCARIRNHPDGASTVVMALTDRGDAEDLGSVLDAGADDYLTKPVDPTLFDIRLAIAEQRVLEVAKRIEAELEMKRLNAGLSKANAQLQEANERLKSNQAQLVHSEKMASLGQLAAGIAHEINNPVGFVKSNLGMLSDYVAVFKDLLDTYRHLAASVHDHPMNGQAELLKRIENVWEHEDLEFILVDVDSLLAESLTGTERVREIAQSLKSFARLDESAMQNADINEGLRATLRMIWNELKYHCTVHEEMNPLPPIRCFPGQLNQVFMNLLVNASQAIKDEGEITIRTDADDDDVIVSISDTGVGIPKENIPKLFNPFFTTKPVGHGTGLGLSVSYGIIKKHKGRIEVDSKVGKGTTFTIHLPISGEDHE